jgi:hypothetical protein
MVGMVYTCMVSMVSTVSTVSMVSSMVYTCRSRLAPRNAEEIVRHSDTIHTGYSSIITCWRVVGGWWEGG